MYESLTSSKSLFIPVNYTDYGDFEILEIDITESEFFACACPRVKTSPLTLDTPKACFSLVRFYNTGFPILKKKKRTKTKFSMVSTIIFVFQLMSVTEMPQVSAIFDFSLLPERTILKENTTCFKWPYLY